MAAVVLGTICGWTAALGTRAAAAVVHGTGCGGVAVRSVGASDSDVLEVI